MGLENRNACRNSRLTLLADSKSMKLTLLGTGTPTEFYDGVRAAVETLNKEYDASALDTSKLNSEELKEAFDEVPECR